MPARINGGIYILRVISGTAKGHKLKTIDGMNTRPTTDRVKESLFNILAPYIEGTSVLDLFAGTGSLGIEALSRGAEFAVFVDRNRDSFNTIIDNLKHTKLLEKSQVMQEEYSSAIEKMYTAGKKFDIILLDPPYSKNFIQDTLNILLKNDIIKNGGIIAAEHDAKDALPERVGRLYSKTSRRYGDTMLTFFIADDEDASAGEK